MKRAASIFSADPTANLQKNLLLDNSIIIIRGCISLLFQREMERNKNIKYKQMVTCKRGCLCTLHAANFKVSCQYNPSSNSAPLPQVCNPNFKTSLLKSQPSLLSPHLSYRGGHHHTPDIKADNGLFINDGLFSLHTRVDLGSLRIVVCEGDETKKGEKSCKKGKKEA